MFKEGELVLLRVKENVSELEGVALDNLHEEGMVFASYDSLIEYLRATNTEASSLSQDRAKPRQSVRTGSCFPDGPP